MFLFENHWLLYIFTLRLYMDSFFLNKIQCERYRPLNNIQNSFCFYDLYVRVSACLKLSFFLKRHGHTESHPTIPFIYLGGSNNIIGGVITFSLSISSSYAAVIVISIIIPYLFRIICDTEIVASNNSKQWTTACTTVAVDDHFVHRFFAGHHPITHFFLLLNKRFNDMLSCNWNKSILLDCTMMWFC